MKELANLLPESISTTVIIGAGLLIYKMISSYLKYKKKEKIQEEKKKVAEEKFKEEILEKERIRSKFEARLVDVEKQVLDVKDDLHEHAADNKEVLKGLGSKMDEILRFLIQKGG